MKVVFAPEVCITSLINVILIRRGIFSSLSLEILILLNT